ncbi:aspartate aminotransferase family protein [Rhodoplanes elegans]|uniref:Aspartate aminotransferase family protein n=1 Tax=Rhodoplanes elegans TaxID=29408 RepID=A0A327KV79_9BRAD|nr:aminotransferase [Rhodoplanes elegans]MBK5959847.1 aspartate aminotransferase family protein [Rhodoplanes elegans]RAI41653.1 aspartate aminotransferase family protein [Rhodoplanes elegans]
MTVFGNQAVRDIETVLHPYTNLAAHRDTGPLMLERGQGVFVYDTSGKDYIEGMAGLWCLSLGHGNEELIEAAASQMRKLSFAHLFNGKSHDPAIELAETLKGLMPVPTSKVFFCNSGSEANDTQVKLVRYMNNALGRPEKKKIIARDKAYHGVTVASASLTGLAANHADFDLPIPGILRTACPHYYRGAQPGESEDDFATRLAAELEALIEAEGPETVAAFIAEPVMGAGGVVVPPASYFPKIQAVCDKYELYVISDEVICGFGRTGKMFGCETLGFRPDSISVAKALSSAYVPIAAVTIPETMYEAMLIESRKIGTFGHGLTYSGHPVAAAVALKTLEIYAREKIVQKVAAKAPQFLGHLTRLADHPLVGNTRGVGLVGGIELVADKATKQGFEPKQGVAAACVRFAEEEGLIVRALANDTISVCPPMIITAEEIDELFRRLDRALARTQDWLRKG